MKQRLRELYQLGIQWLKRLLRSPFSNFATRITLGLGGTILATPLFEHLVANAVLKRVFNVDLGINVPDMETFLFGTIVVALALAHNLTFVWLNQSHQLELMNHRTSFYKELWSLLDAMVDDTARLAKLYITRADDDDFECAEKADASFFAFLEFVRKNRPFFLTESLYDDCTTIARSCKTQVTAFRYCAHEKRKEDSSYLFEEAYKVTKAEIREISDRYDALAEKIRDEVVHI